MKKSDSDAPCEGLSIDGLKTMIQRGRITNEWIDELLINEFRMHEIKNEQLGLMRLIFGWAPVDCFQSFWVLGGF
jgi:hypothetical protein